MKKSKEQRHGFERDGTTGKAFFIRGGERRQRTRFHPFDFWAIGPTKTLTHVWMPSKRDYSPGLP